MEQEILVAYASTHGATREVAELVAAELRGQGFSVDLQPARQVKKLAGYNAVVLGAPLYIFRLHVDARRFLTRHRHALGGLPLAIFAGGPFGKGDADEWQEVRKMMDAELAKYPWLTPVSVEVVGGRFDPTRLRFPWNLIPAMKQIPGNDLRDWEAIRAWAGGLAEHFALSVEARR